MMARTVTGSRGTANDRLKASFGGWVWGSVMLAAVFHFALFEFFPSLTAADLGREETKIFELLPPPEIEIPPPPDEIQRPKVPVPGKTEISEDVTIHPTTFKDNPVDNLPPPPAEGIEETSRFTPYTVRPELKDPAEALRIVERKYPPLLKAAGVGGSVTVLAYIDTLGLVLDVETALSSGNTSLDQAALEAVYLFRFTPALNRDRKVAVWVQQKIVFEVK